MAHTHNVIDDDKHFIIDPATKEITHETGKIVLIQRSHNSERFTFSLPKVIEGHDMTQCNSVKIHYTNIELETGTEAPDVYEVEDFGVSETDDSEAVFSWLISGNATQYIGCTNFSVSFECVADDGTLDYVWPTAEFVGVIIAKSRYNSEAVIAEHSDALETRMAEYDARLDKWYEDLYLASIGEGVSVAEVRTMLGIVPIKATSVTIPASGWTDYTQTVNVDGVTADSEKCHVQIAYAPESYTDYRYSGVRCTAQGEGTVTFTCDIVPTVDITANILIFEEQGV